jgi:hypothetical protein
LRETAGELMVLRLLSLGAFLYLSLNVWVLFVRWAAQQCVPLGLCA